MLKDTEILNEIYQTTQMGRDGIQAVLPRSEDGHFKDALRQQLTEYEKIMESSTVMLKARGHEPQGVNPMAKSMVKVSSAVKTMTDHSPSKIAEMMIQGNTMGMTESLRSLHDYHGSDERIQDLAQKLLKTEEANIQQMKKFL